MWCKMSVLIFVEQCMQLCASYTTPVSMLLVILCVVHKFCRTQHRIVHNAFSCYVSFGHNFTTHFMQLSV